MRIDNKVLGWRRVKIRSRNISSNRDRIARSKDITVSLAKMSIAIAISSRPVLKPEQKAIECCLESNRI